MNRRIFLAIGIAMAFSLSGCALFTLAGYAIWPDYPEFEEGQRIPIPGMDAPVEVAMRDDGVPRIEATTEKDLMRTVGYLQARDRLFQMDMLRHTARGRLTEMLGDRPLGSRTSLEIDKFHRFIGFQEAAESMVEKLTPEEHALLESFSEGVNYWARTGPASLEHRLLGEAFQPWQPSDTVAILRLIMFGMTHNYSRELMRLLIACDAGLEAMERIWPTDIVFGPVALPEEAVGEKSFPTAPAVAPEMAEWLPRLCPEKSEEGAASFDPTEAIGLELFDFGIAASNNWVVSGAMTRSGMPIVANDPHLPHLNPPILWGMEAAVGEKRLAGFMFAGTPSIVFGHNGRVAWGGTINNVDIQDLYVEMAGNVEIEGKKTEAYNRDGTWAPFRVKSETFHIKDEEPVTLTARFTVHGPLLNDLVGFVDGRIPFTSIQSLPLDDPDDLSALRNTLNATTVEEYVEAIGPMNSACINWVAADVEGKIAYTSPCLAPKRDGYLGTFPAPGWLSRYDWKGFRDKEALPRIIDPQQGWIATANNRILPRGAMDGAYNNDPSPPNRWLRIAGALRGSGDHTVASLGRIQQDVAEDFWPSVREGLEGNVCHKHFGEDPLLAKSREIFCDWRGALDSDSVGASLFVLTTHALLDRALADELSEGANGELWKYVQSIPHFETNVDWLWVRPESDPVWDDARTEGVETRRDIVEAALAEATRIAEDRWGDDPNGWRWGEIRPFVLRHPFGQKRGVLANLFNSETLPGVGNSETVFKNQFLRSDRHRMDPKIGPVIRYLVDMSDPWGAVYTLAGGQSGWAKSPHYADRLEAWRNGEFAPLTPTPDQAKERRFVITVGPEE